MTQPIKETFDAQGFVILPNLIPPDLRAELEQASENVISKTRSGAWQHRRVVGKQFPPYGNAGVDSWGVQHVMHPDLGEPAFAKWYSSHGLREAVKELLGCSDDNLQMGMRGLHGYSDRSADQGRRPIELFNLLINPESHDFALRWHRDDVKGTASEEEEREALAVWHHGVSSILYETLKHESKWLATCPTSR